MLVSFIALLFLCLYAIDVGAHGGPWAVAAPVSGITADGDLTDWPTNVSRQAISHHIWGERAGERDLSATLSVAYGLSDSMLFVSVEAIDDSEVTDSSAGTQGTDGATLYVAIGHDKVIQAELLGDARLDGPVRGRSLHRQGVHTYEWSVPLANHSDVLSGRSIIGLDVAIGDRDADGTFSRVSWGQVRPHWPLAGEIGDVWIATGDDAAIAGCVEWEDPEEGATLGRVRLRRIDSPSYETQVSTGADGCFRLTNLAAGEYEVSAGFWYEATARIGDWATWTAIDSVDLLPGRSADLPRTSVPRPRGGRVVRHVFESPSLAESLIGERSARVLTVYVPEAYDSSSDSFALIYWFPGFNGIGLPFRSRSWLDQAIKEGHLQSAIIVGFDLETAYGGSFLLNSRVFGRWENFVVDEVVPYLDASYRTIPSPKGRIAMGTSVGGWSALMLSVLHPGVWGSVGADDPSVWLMWDYVSDSDDFPQQSSWQDVPSSIKLLPESLTGLSSADIDAMTITVLGGTLSPDPEMPLGFVPPMAADGSWNPSARKQWQVYNLAHPIGLARHGDALRALNLSIATTKDSTEGNARAILDLASIWEQSGIATEVIRIPGTHWMSAERFFALAQRALQTRQAKPQSKPGLRPIMEDTSER